MADGFITLTLIFFVFLEVTLTLRLLWGKGGGEDGVESGSDWCGQRSED